MKVRSAISLQSMSTDGGKSISAIAFASPPHKSKAIARDLVEAVRRNVSIDWTERETVRAKLRAIVKRLLRKYGYPPDKQEKATQTVIQQAETLCKDWAA